MLKHAMVRDIVKYSIRLLLALNVLATWKFYEVGNVYAVFVTALITNVLFDVHTKFVNKLK